MVQNQAAVAFLSPRRQTSPRRGHVGLVARDPVLLAAAAPDSSQSPRWDLNPTMRSPLTTSGVKTTASGLLADDKVQTFKKKT